MDKLTQHFVQYIRYKDIVLQRSKDYREKKQRKNKTKAKK